MFLTIGDRNLTLVNTGYRHQYDWSDGVSMTPQAVSSTDNSPLTEGIYNLTFTYIDACAAAVRTTTLLDIFLDPITLPVTFNSSDLNLFTSITGVHLSFTLGEQPLNNSVQLVFNNGQDYIKNRFDIASR